MRNALLYIMQNYKPLSVSLFLAVVLWFVVKTDQEYTINLNADLKLKSLAPEMVLLEPIPDKVQVKVQAKGRSLIAIRFYRNVLGLELPDFTKSSVINLNDYITQFNFPAELNIKVLEILHPKQLDIKIDKFLSKQIPVKIVYKIKPLPGYILSSVNKDADSVWVSGPQSIVEKTQYIYSDSIIKKDVKYPFDITAKLIAPKKIVTKVSPAETNVRFKVERLVERSFYNVPIQIVGIPDGFEASATPKNISVRVKGAESRIANLKPLEIAAIYNFAAYYKPGEIKYSVQIQLPQNVELVEASPAEFRLNLKRITQK